MLSISFYKLLAEITRAFPAQYRGAEPLPCLRPNSFLVITDTIGDLNSDNGGKDARYEHKPYFFSRSFEHGSQNPSARTLDYPVIYAMELDTNIEASGRVSTTYKIAVSDLINQAQNNCTTPCQLRTDEEIGEDVKRIAIRLIRQLKHVSDTEYKQLEYRIYLNTAVNGRNKSETTGTLGYKLTNAKEVSFVFDVTVDYNYCAEPFEIEIKPLGKPDNGCCP
jgi:hypothetical protein